MKEAGEDRGKGSEQLALAFTRRTSRVNQWSIALSVSPLTWSHA